MCSPLLAGCPLVYVNFLNNAIAYLPWLLEHRVPFVTTLYPGGGFGLHEAASDAKLAQLSVHVIDECFSQKR